MHRILILLAFTMFPTICIAQYGDYEDSWDDESPAKPVGRLNVLEGFDRFKHDQRIHIHDILDMHVQRIWNSRYTRELQSTRSNTFSKLPRLVISDRDADRRADQFSYLPEQGGDTQDFGFMFDLNRDGLVDYVLFYQGTMVSTAGGSFRMVWTFYHWIDSNYDGRIDILVFPDADRNQDKELDLGVYAWLYDTDFNGTLDSGEYAGAGVQEPIEIVDGRLDLKIVLQRKIEHQDTALLEFANKVLIDLNGIRGLTKP